MANIIDKLNDVVRSSVLSGNKRIDGRSKEDVISIFSEVDVMPRTIMVLRYLREGKLSFW